MTKNNEQIIKLDGSFITIEQAKKAGLLRNEEIIIDEFNAKEYAKTAFELAKETLAEKDQLREYYDKLLQRKEQECKELKDKLNNGSEMSLDCALLAEIDRLTQEKEWFKSVADGYSVMQSQLRDDRRKLKQTLAEIKEIAELKQKQSVFVGETVFEQILQKINECEGENEV